MQSPAFPWIWTLPITRKTLLVDRLQKECHEEAFLLIQDAAKRGDNMGQFEIATKEYFDFILGSTTSALVLSDINAKKVECLILMAPAATFAAVIRRCAVSTSSRQRNSRRRFSGASSSNSLRRS